MSKVKEILKELYPDADLAKGLDFDKSGSVEEGEEIKDLDKNGRIDDVDYGILTFNNKEHFIDSHGARKWKELERYWNEAAKRPRSIFAERASIDATKDPKKEELQKRIQNADRSAGAGDILKKQASLLELKKRYPNLDLDRIDPSQVEEVGRDLKTIEEFSPNLAHKLRYIKKDLTLNACAGEGNDGAGAKALRALLIAGCVSDEGIVINPVFDAFAGDEALIHEAAHIHHNDIIGRDRRELENSKDYLNGYAHHNGYHLHSKRKNEERGVSLPEDPVTDTLRDNIEKHIELKKSGKWHNANLLRIYDQYLNARRGSFEYEWYHANDKVAGDEEFNDVEKAGQRYERASSKLEAVLVEGLGKEASDPFWKDEFYWGGERSELTLKGHIRDKVGAIDPSSEKGQLLNAAIKEWKGSKKEYRRLAAERFSSNIVRMEVGDGEMVIFNKSTRNYGMPSLYAFTNDHEAVAEVVRDAYVEKRDGRSNDPLASPLAGTTDSQKDRQMRENYIQVLRRHGFVK